MARRRKSAYAPLDKSKLPPGVYWDNSGRGHWYTIFKEGGKQRRRKIAGADATIADLHKIMDTGEINCLSWLSARFEASPQFKAVSKSQQKSYRYARKIVCKHSTRKQGITLGQIPLKDWNPGLVQKLIDSVGEKNGPSAAKKVKEFLSRVFNWGMNRAHVLRNPVGKPEMPPERKLRRLPEWDTLNRLIPFARQRGSTAKRKGSCAPYIWYVLTIARKCRERGIEVFTTTDDQLLPQGVAAKRRKGSFDNVALYDDALREAVSAALEFRATVWDRTRQPVPIKPEQRHLVVGVSGQPLSQSTWQSAWRRFMELAISEGVIKREDWFGLHDMKRRGVTDTPGTKRDKLDASGHADRRTLDVYDLSVPEVPAAPEGGK